MSGRQFGETVSEPPQIHTLLRTFYDTLVTASSSTGASERLRFTRMTMSGCTCAGCRVVCRACRCCGSGADGCVGSSCMGPPRGGAAREAMARGGRRQTLHAPPFSPPPAARASRAGPSGKDASELALPSLPSLHQGWPEPARVLRLHTILQERLEKPHRIAFRVYNSVEYTDT